MDFLELDINVPIDVEYTGISLNVGGGGIPIIGDISPFMSDYYGTLFNLDINSNTKGKKENNEQNSNRTTRGCWNFSKGNDDSRKGEGIQKRFTVGFRLWLPNA